MTIMYKAAMLLVLFTQGIYQRPTTAQASITGSPKLRDGNFTATGISSICGEVPMMSSMTGTAVFNVEFPNDTPRGSITSISFGSKELVGGKTRSTKFLLNVSVVTANGGRPPAYVLHTENPKPGNTGVATLTKKGRAVTLKVTGREDMGETISLTVTCS
jgi:hypothetical protein